MFSPAHVIPGRCTPYNPGDTRSVAAPRNR